MLHDALSHIRPFITPMPTFHSNELIYFTAVHCNFALNYTWGVGGGYSSPRHTLSNNAGAGIKQKREKQ